MWSLLTLCEKCHETAPVIRSNPDGRPGDYLESLIALGDAFFTEYGLSDPQHVLSVFTLGDPVEIAGYFKELLRSERPQ